MHRLLLVLIVAWFALSPAARAQDDKKDHESLPAPKINYEALDKLGWKLGSQAYTWRSRNLLDTLDILKRLDLRYIELWPGQKFSSEGGTKVDSLSDAQIEQLQAKFKETNVTPMAYGVVDLPNDEAKARKIFDYVKKLGIKEIVSEPSPEALPLVDKLAEEYDMKVAIHNHPAPSRYFDCATVIEATKERSDRIGACADLGHWVRSGLSSPECLKKLEGKIISLHVKDIDERKFDVPWGTGTVDIAACLKELKRQNIKPLFSVEYERGQGTELIANVAKSIQYFSDRATELAKE
jgi:sugar phosphate isomerase/epimerase